MKCSNKGECEVQRRHMIQEWSNIIGTWVAGRKSGSSSAFSYSASSLPRELSVLLHFHQDADESLIPLKKSVPGFVRMTR